MVTTISSTRKFCYKKRNLFGVKLGREVPKTIIGDAAAEVAT